MDGMATNEMALAKAFRDAGFEQEKAELLSETIFDAIRDNVATKGDLALTKADLRADIAAVRTDLERLEHRLVVRGLGALTAGLGILFAALHHWPPHS